MSFASLVPEKATLVTFAAVTGFVKVVMLTVVRVSLTNVAEAVAPQFPAESWPWTKIVCVPWLSALNCPPVRVAVTPSVGLLKLASLADMAVPAPFVPTLSMKYSAWSMLLPPLVASLTLAVTVGAVLVGDGATFTPLVVGPKVSGSSPTT